MCRSRRRRLERSDHVLLMSDIWPLHCAGMDMAQVIEDSRSATSGLIKRSAKCAWKTRRTRLGDNFSTEMRHLRALA
jgi:hypothetical protein